MPQPTFHGDPYRVLGVPAASSDAAIKRRWRELARELHPDRAADPQEAARLTRQMARINAAYDLLRDADRRSRYDVLTGRRAAWRGAAGAAFAPDDTEVRPAGPPRPRPTRPVTARFDTSAAIRTRQAGARSRDALDGQRPVSARERRLAQEPLRASDPCGPVYRRRGGTRPRVPTLAMAREMPLLFGRFRGHTLGQVELFEPTYIDWIARTITRDRDLVVAARVIQADMDDRGVERRVRAPSPGFGAGRTPAGSA